jgi:hypothetical protein
MPEKRVVAFLDVLGFSDEIETKSLDELAMKYERIIAQVRAFLRPLQIQEQHLTLFPNRSSDSPWCNLHIFSDSIILIANTDTEVGCLEILVYAWRLAQFLLGAGMPPRGGISYGEIHSNSKTGVFLGRALTRAYRLEQSQDWIGISIDETLRYRYREIFANVEDTNNPVSVIFKRYPVPKKDGTREDLFTINWRFAYVIEKGTRSLFQRSDKPEVNRKIDNTLEYAKSIIDGGKVYWTDDSLVPVELRTFFVGGRQPPFPHGDDL